MSSRRGTVVGKNCSIPWPDSWLQFVYGQFQKTLELVNFSTMTQFNTWACVIKSLVRQEACEENGSILPHEGQLHAECNRWTDVCSGGVPHAQVCDWLQ